MKQEAFPHPAPQLGPCQPIHTERGSWRHSLTRQGLDLTIRTEHFPFQGRAATLPRVSLAPYAESILHVKMGGEE